MDLFQFNSKENSNFKMMGVINITPDSFSDGGKYTTLSTIKNQINHFRSYDCKCFDFGAESTAPFNKAITDKEEQDRLAPLLELIREGEFREDEVLSFDTYKISTFRRIVTLIRGCGLNNRVLFNDVSGILDEDLFSLMEEFEFDYVYSHSLAPTREQTNEHMNFLSEEIDLNEYFKIATSEFTKRNLLERVIFDPCFGFSKTATQNLELISNIEEWIKSSNKWVLGISRKSFLKGLSKSERKEEQVFFSELLHSQVLVNWMKVLHDQSIFIRLHDPAIFFSAQLVK